MKDKELLYSHIKQTQLNEWKSGMLQIRTKALAARAHLQVALNKHVKLLETKLEEGKMHLDILMKTTGSNFEYTKKTFEITWDEIIQTLEETRTKFQAIA